LLILTLGSSIGGVGGSFDIWISHGRGGLGRTTGSGIGFGAAAYVTLVSFVCFTCSRLPLDVRCIACLRAVAPSTLKYIRLLDRLVCWMCVFAGLLGRIMRAAAKQSKPCAHLCARFSLREHGAWVKFSALACRDLGFL
jgi:hypothetical protein